MKQVFLSGKGEVELFDVPLPGRMRDAVLVRSQYSLISSGTEGAAVASRGGWLGVYEKVRASPKRVEQVWEIAKAKGIKQTLQLVNAKLDDYTPLGYSCAGEVIELNGDVPHVNVGDRVACIGNGFANHAEYVTVPKNLVVPIPEGVSSVEACFGALASIALHGIRRLELTPGERIGVIGLGLIGQLAVRLLVAMGYEVMGIDIDADRARAASAVPGVVAWSTNDAASTERVADLTGGIGLDGVIVTAATPSDEPLNMAFDLCRAGGRVSLIGDVGLHLQRSKMYRKEIELRMACSYGPGRYDPSYEIHGTDYPIRYVRWSEQRNLEFFLRLLATRDLQLADLVSKRYPIADAQTAYRELKTATGREFGFVLEYEAGGDNGRRMSAQRTMRIGAAVSRRNAKTIRIGLIGAGSFARAVHVPNIQKLSEHLAIHSVVSRTGATARIVGHRVGAAVISSDYHEILDDSDLDAVLICTRHASHARIIMDALDAGKHVFVEKPMTIDVEDGVAVQKRVEDTGIVLRVGFNRRFSPHVRALRQIMGSTGRRIFTARINVGPVRDHWSSQPEEGGRVMGEGVHFFDLASWIMDQEPAYVAAATLGNPEIINPDISITVGFPDGSLAHILYVSAGDPRLGKEYFEVFGNGQAAFVNDYRTLEAAGRRNGKGVARRHRGDKGQLAGLREFARAIRGETSEIRGADARAGLLATWMAAAAYESARNGQRISRQL